MKNQPDHFAAIQIFTLLLKHLRSRAQQQRHPAKHSYQRFGGKIVPKSIPELIPRSAPRALGWRYRLGACFAEKHSFPSGKAPSSSPEAPFNACTRRTLLAPPEGSMRDRSACRDLLPGFKFRIACRNLSHGFKFRGACQNLSDGFKFRSACRNLFLVLSFEVYAETSSWF